AAKAGAVLALANKEALVCAGPILLEAVRKAGTRILPVDSEHNAIFQVFEEANRSHIRRLVLTASGGPFRDWDAARTARATPADAVRHPNWSMGAKISVDSATLMNKGLEVIEAHHLFAMDEDRIEVVVHPQSVVHSFVDYADGSMLAQLGAPDMRTALSVCLAWPERMQAPVPPLDLLSCGNLTFEAPDTRRFPALDLARDALRAGGTAPVILNGANEVAVQSFLDGTLVFPDISSVIAETMSRVPSMPLTDIETVRDADCRARIVARDVMSRLSRS
ncbi:MAG: 1-deoxy-D-xylulose-5-phosphate reductoisomerase, partial [Pseudomonadota bacterium]|nr:1-deoxy-D-xylulose-5-phosphate reductoisomerase [Pseudomonadota bacterium]